ncbi:MAG: hypothetical protein ACTII7_04975 [Galactobacter sp.]
MQELLGRLGALDPEVGQGLRVIASFDELMSGAVAVRGLLAAASALSGATAGAEIDGATLRVTPRGDDANEPIPPSVQRGPGEPHVWIERPADQAHANDAIVLERLALAVRLRLDPHHSAEGNGPGKRDLGIAVDASADAAERVEAAPRLGLSPTAHYRVLAAPLFATWTKHPRGPEDVMATPHGPVHLSIIRDGAQAVGSPLGAGISVDLDALPHSAETAVIALRLHDASRDADRPVDAEALGGLVETLAVLPGQGGHDRDAEAMDRIMSHPWGRGSVDALVEAASIREAARLAGVHHSTMNTRTEAIAGELGFDPLSGLGRTRLGMAYLRWRLRHSTVLTLPAPSPP